jgi:hypothetical protein
MFIDTLSQASMIRISAVLWCRHEGAKVKAEKLSPKRRREIGIKASKAARRGANLGS